jgi:hypothetical protein
MGSGIFLTGTYDARLKSAIFQKKNESNGGIVLTQSDFAKLEQIIGSQNSIPVLISGSERSGRASIALINYAGI